MSEDIKDFVKGDIAEVLVAKLFRHSGYTVKWYGAWKAATMDTFRTPQLCPHRRRSDYPDFIIGPKGDKEIVPELVEVRYRHNGELGYRYKASKRLRSQCRYWGPVATFSVIVVRSSEKPYFNVLRSPYIDDNDHFLPRQPLADAGWHYRKKRMMSASA